MSIARITSYNVCYTKLLRAAENGLQWKTDAGVRTIPDMTQWQGKRAQVGKPVPPGFPRNLRFGFDA